MKASPIQLLDATLLKVHIDQSENEKFDGQYYTPIDFEKVAFKTAKSINPAPDYWSQGEPPVPGMEARTFAIQLAVKSDVLPEDEGEWSPYTFEIVFGVVVAVVPESGKSSPKNMAFQYGLQFAFGSIRDLLLNLTSRMQHGQMLLPTMSFMDEIVPEKSDATPA